MTSPVRRSSSAFSKAGILLLLTVVILVVLWGMRPSVVQSNQPAESRVQAANISANQPSQGGTPRTAKLTRAVLLNWTNFLKRPLPVAYESTNFQWTLADGRDTNVIRQLAHNPLEYDRMVEENPRIFRRELVYLKQTSAAVFEQAKLTRELVGQLTLPGVDGQELQFDIIKSEGDGSSRQGQFSGHLKGNTDSLVTLAFMDGREAFTVIDPRENIYLVGEPREDGQVIVKAIDPNTYGLGPAEADDSIKTQPTGK